MAPMRVPCAPTMTYRKTPLYFECLPFFNDTATTENYTNLNTLFLFLQL
eukprot:COSAG01_NODE_35637_length_529_cov_0.641860_1_plen_48_part_10